MYAFVCVYFIMAAVAWLLFPLYLLTWPMSNNFFPSPFNIKYFLLDGGQRLMVKNFSTIGNQNLISLYGQFFALLCEILFIRKHSFQKGFENCLSFNLHEFKDSFHFSLLPLLQGSLQNSPSFRDHLEWLLFSAYISSLINQHLWSTDD